jgi:hydroxyacylglutathione hydrolase
MTFNKGPFAGSYLNAEGVPELSCEELGAFLKSEAADKVVLIDVRRPEEVSGELGHIEGSSRLTLETDFARDMKSLDPQATYVFVCRSGARSSRAAGFALAHGFSSCFNLSGGMMAWNQLHYPVSKKPI